MTAFSIYETTTKNRYSEHATTKICFILHTSMYYILYFQLLFLLNDSLNTFSNNTTEWIDRPNGVKGARNRAK